MELLGLPTCLQLPLQLRDRVLLGNDLVFEVLVGCLPLPFEGVEVLPDLFELSGFDLNLLGSVLLLLLVLSLLAGELADELVEAVQGEGVFLKVSSI